MPSITLANVTMKLDFTTRALQVYKINVLEKTIRKVTFLSFYQSENLRAYVFYTFC